MTNILEKIIKEKKETLVKIKKDKSLSSLEDKIKKLNSFFNFKDAISNNKKVSIISEIILKYFKFSFLKIPVFFILLIINKIFKFLSKDYNTYYLGVHCSCKK